MDTVRARRGRSADDPAAAIPGLDAEVAAFLAAQRVGRLATCGPDGAPHVVPVCFAWDPDRARLYIALDAKPKRVDVRRLKRVRNILANPQVALVCDHYEEDWARLRYVLVHATAGLLEPGTAAQAAALVLLRAKYRQYRAMALEANPVIALGPTRVTAWAGGTTE